MENFQLLHISDLHFSTQRKFDSSILLDALLNRAIKDKKNGLKPEIVIVSGDIARTGLKSEYNLAKQFFDKLLDCLNIPNDHLFIVPGNHDVNRQKYRPKDIPSYENMLELNNELEHESYRDDLLKGMADYFNFVEVNYPHLQSKQKRLIPFVHTYPSKSGKQIGLVGLNSAWMCRSSSDQGTIAIGEFQVKKAIEELNDKDGHDLIFYIFHHPLGWLWPVDRKICRTYFKDSIVLTGHLHDSDGGYIQDLDGRLYQFQAGASYIGSEDLNKYSYITVNWDNKLIDLHFRKFANHERRWVIDGDKGQDGTVGFQLSSPSMIIDVDTEDIIKENNRFLSYAEATINAFRYLSTSGFETNLRVPVAIKDVLISPRFHIQSEEKSVQDTTVIKSIKEVFEYSNHQNVKDIVILGDPGSGKTTILKYILISLIEGSGRKSLGLNNDIIPFYAHLRNLSNSDNRRFFDFIKEECLLQDFSISEYSLRKLFDEGRAIVLLDGLDEIIDQDNRIKACQWIDQARIRLPKVKFIITSRHLGYFEKCRFYGNIVELSVQDFTFDDIKTFLIRWFQAIESAMHPGLDEDMWRHKGLEEASALIEIINRIDRLKEFAGNPLILRMISLVHRDRGTLPNRIVDFYEEYVNVLLEKWDMAKALDIRLTAREARFILQPLALWFHKKEGRRHASLVEIKELIESSFEKLDKTHIDSAQFIRAIRDRSGLFIEYSENEYGFIHLSVQEYLAAEEIRSQKKINLLLDHFNDSWWRQVVLFCLALDNPSIIEEFMGQLIATDRFNENYQLVMEALNNSIVKPTKPFIDALTDTSLSDLTKQKCINVLEHIGDSKVMQILSSFTFNKNKKIASYAKKAVSKNIFNIPNPSKQAERIQSKAQIFLCYAREDAKLVENLYNKLANEGFKPWMDKKNILPGQRWGRILINEIIRSDFFLACLSPHSERKRGVLQKEIKHALEIWQTKLDSDIYLIPVRLQMCEVPDNLAAFQWVDLFDDYGYGLLIKALHAGIERQST